MSVKSWSTDEFQHVLAVHTGQLRSMRNMPKMRRLGKVEVRSRDFSDACVPYPDHVLKQVTDRLPVLAFARNEELLSVIKGASRKLDKSPADVAEFVEHLTFLDKMASEMAALEREFDIVTKMYTICKDFNVEVEPEQLALYQTLAPSFQHLKVCANNFPVYNYVLKNVLRIYRSKSCVRLSCNRSYWCARQQFCGAKRKRTRTWRTSRTR